MIRKIGLTKAERTAAVIKTAMTTVTSPPTSRTLCGSTTVISAAGIIMTIHRTTVITFSWTTIQTAVFRISLAFWQ